MPPKRRSSPLPQQPPSKRQATLEEFTHTKIHIPDGAQSDDDIHTLAPSTSLSEEQAKALRLVVDEGKSMFITGSAGTGKSYLLKHIISSLLEKHGRNVEYVAITASTGAAACEIGGQTLHSWASVSPGDGDTGVLLGKILCRKAAVDRYAKAKVLIIDESKLSMVPPELFDLVILAAQRIRSAHKALANNHGPAGGLQLVATGDFFQLPPVTNGRQEPRFAFEAASWNRVFDFAITLTHVFRQSDKVFVGFLNELRIGRLSPAAVKAFQTLSRDLPGPMRPTLLFPHRRKVEDANATRLGAIKAPLHKFESTDSARSCKCGAVDEGERKKRLEQLDQLPVPHELRLKTGAQVILVRNIDQSRNLVNGTLGRVCGFRQAQTTLMRQTLYEVTLDDKGRLVPDPYGGCLTEETYPLVDFVTPGGNVRVLVCPHPFKLLDPLGHCRARRDQLPLVLGYAQSIHGSQGKTLQRVAVDVGKSFAPGQVYVAISRASTREGLQILGFKPEDVKVHDKVRVWSETLCTVDSLQPLKHSKPARTEPASATASATLAEDTVWYEDLYDIRDPRLPVVRTTPASSSK